MKSSIKIINNYEYKKLFLPDVTEHNLFNESKIQVYRIENYLRSILMPVIPYRTTFNFLIFVTKGTLTQHLESGSYTLAENQVINVKQGNITATLAISDDAEGFFIVYENEIVTDIELGINDIRFFNSHPFTPLSEHVSVWIQKMLELLEEELFTEGKVMEICVSMLQCVLLKIIKTDYEVKAPMSRQLDIAFRFREFVQKFHTDHKNVLFYANLLHISENYLNKCVKEATNKPPKQWINEISILHSQILLQNATRDIAGIAFEMKYKSPSYFTRLFKKVTGYSPSDYRKHKFLSD